MSIRNNLGLGIILMLVAYLFFTGADTTTKAMRNWGYLAFQLAFMRYLFQFLFAGVESSFRGIKREEITDNLWLLSLRGVALSSASAIAFISFLYVDLSIFSAIMFSSPFFVSLLSMPILGEKVGKWRWAAIALGFIGVLIVVRPFSATIHWTAILALYPAFMMALYSLLTRKLAASVRPHIQQVSTGLVGMLILAPIALLNWQPITWPVFLLMGWVGFASWFGHEILTRAHALAPASMLMPYSYSFIIYMTLTGFVFFDEVPDQFTILGALVIVISGLIIWQREGRMKPL